MRKDLFAALVAMSGGWIEYANFKTPLLEFCRKAVEDYGENIPDWILAEALRRFAPGQCTVADLRARMGEEITDMTPTTPTTPQTPEFRIALDPLYFTGLSLEAVREIFGRQTAEELEELRYPEAATPAPADPADYDWRPPVPQPEVSSC